MRATWALSSAALTLTLTAACSTGEDASAGGFTSATPTVPVPTNPTTVGTTSDAGATDGATAGEPTGGETGGPTDTGGDPTGHGEEGHAEAEAGLTEQGETGDTATTGPVIPMDPSCDDGTLNQDETDVDCGGAVCAACGLGEVCKTPMDCETESCIMGLCTDPSCSDGAKNGDETDVDCGGGCGPCDDNEGCIGDADCVSQVCTNEVCTPPSCGDGEKNGAETDVDCGGGCMGCGEGLPCGGDTDCLSGFCSDGKCAPKECDADSGCAQFNSACTKGVCNASKKCEAQNSNEGGACDDGNKCMTGEKCAGGVCGGAVAKDCSAMSSVCALGVCDTNSGNCTAQPANEGNPCDDGKPCTVAETCSAGACKDAANPNGYLLYEPFANNSAGWQLGTEWGITGAKASAGHESGYADPSTDHTPTGDNGVAGVSIGGNATTSLHDYYFLTSPAVDTTKIPGAVFVTYWRWLNSDFNPYMDNHIDVFDGNTWVNLFFGPTSGPIEDNAWSQQSFEVTAYKNPSFRFRIGHKVGNSLVFIYSGWNLDDVVIGPAVCMP